MKYLLPRLIKHRAVYPNLKKSHNRTSPWTPLIDSGRRTPINELQFHFKTRMGRSQVLLSESVTPRLRIGLLKPPWTPRKSRGSMRVSRRPSPSSTADTVTAAHVYSDNRAKPAEWGRPSVKRRRSGRKARSDISQNSSDTVRHTRKKNTVCTYSH